MVIRLAHMPGEDPAPGGKPPRTGNKFGARRTSCQHGHMHASTAEARRCNDLTLLQRGGHIRGLEQQPRVYFTGPAGHQVRDDRGRPIRYTADFRYEERDRAGGWCPIVEDVKSTATMTEAAKLRLAFFRANYPELELRITR